MPPRWIEAIRSDQLFHLERAQRLGRKWGLIFIVGLAYVALGAVALAVPVASTVGLTLMLSALLFIAGLILLFQAIRLRSEANSLARFLQAGIALVIGVLMFRFPEGGMMGLALALSFYFFLRAAVEWMLSSYRLPGRGRWLGFLSALLAFTLGLFIVFTFPFSALWIPGTLLGVDLIFAGATTVAISLALRKLAKEPSRQNSRDIPVNNRATI